MLSRNESFTYEYQGSRFRLEPRGWYPRENEYEITGIVTESEKLYLPDTYNGKPITRWDMQEKETPLATVRFLFVPASIADITISNRFFPNLERIEVASDSPKLSTDGQMLFSADGKELLYSLAAGNQERVVVPNTVRKIAKERSDMLRVQIFHLKILMYLWRRMLLIRVNGLRSRKITV